MLSNLKSVESTKEIDTYYPNNSQLAKKTAHVLRMSAEGKPGEALDLWNDAHLLKSSDNQNLVKGILLGELGRREESAELLWQAYADRPDSFIRALHWMVCVLGKESEADGVARNSEILVRRITGEWGEKTIKSKALLASYAYFLDDYISYFEYLAEIIEQAENTEDRFWAFSKMSDIQANVLPETLRPQFHQLIKQAVREFPINETFYAAWIAALYFEQDFATLADVAAAEIKAGNVRRLSVESREAFVMSLLIASSFEDAQSFYAASGLSSVSSVPAVSLLGHTFEFESRLRRYLRGEQSIEELANLEIMLLDIEEISNSLDKNDYPGVINSFAELIRESRIKLGIT